MEWFYVSDGAKVGPVTRSELDQRRSAYLINDQTLVCHKDASEWQPYSDLTTTAGPTGMPPVIRDQFIVTPELSMDQLRDPKEQTAFTFLLACGLIGAVLLLALFLTVIIFFPLIWLAQKMSEYFAAAYIKTHSIRVTEQQLPHVHKAVKHCCYKLNVPPPEVYVMQNSIWNAFAAHMAGQQMVVLFSGAVDSILLRGDMKQLTWLIGHEIGHLAAGHLKWTRKFAMLGAWVPWLYLWYSRRCELTCDRIALYCVGESEPCYLALANATVGAQLAKDVNITAAINDAETFGNEFFVRYRTMYSTHPSHLARLQQMRAAALEFGIR